MTVSVHNPDQYRSIFFVEKSPRGELIDYHATVAGDLQLVPGDGALAALASDYRHMVDDAEPVEALLQPCRVIQQKANAPSALEEVPSAVPL